MQLLHYLVFLGLLVVSNATNIPTAVVQLSDRFLEVKDEGYWFVKLYAPWCAHCKRMAPVWEHVGHSLADKNPLIRTSSMDCTLYPRACQELGVTGYPTLMFFRNGQVLQYEGEREKEAMVDYALKAAAPLVTPIQTINQYNEIKSLSVREPVFLRVTPESGDEAGEGSVAEAFKNAASDLLAKSRFYSISSRIAPEALKEGAVYVLRDVGVEAFDGDAASLLAWAYGERLPLLPKASAATLAALGLSEKLIVLIVANQVDRFTAGHSVGALYATGLAAAKTARGDEELRKRVQFAWVDGGSLVSSIAMQPIEPPFVLVLNYSSYEFYLPQDAPEQMTEASLLLWLRETVLSPDTVPQGGRSLLLRVKRVIYEIYTTIVQMFSTQPLLSCCLFGVPIAFLSMITYSLCMADFTVDRDEIYPDDEDDEERELLGESDEEEEEERERRMSQGYDNDHQKND